MEVCGGEGGGVGVGGILRWESASTEGEGVGGWKVGVGSISCEGLSRAEVEGLALSGEFWIGGRILYKKMVIVWSIFGSQ